MGQFTIYSSTDGGGPGTISGQAGALITILDACLVNGYPGKAAAGWTQPIATAGNIACYTQGAGAGFNLVVNDNGPNGTSTFREAWAVGWETLAGIGAPVGTGAGQFPLPAQLLTTGHVVWRKSATADATARQWVVIADASTFYLAISTGDTVGVYYGGMFGDVFSLKGAADAYRCMIVGRAIENSAAGATTTANSLEDFDIVPIYRAATPAVPSNIASAGHFLARTVGGGGASISATKSWDVGISSIPIGSRGYAVAGGTMQTPNSPDNSYYLSPVSIVEDTVAIRRGRWRGVYQVCHPAASFADGQTFSGGGDFAGKTFQIVKGFVNGGYYAFETSNTVETN